MGVHGAISLGTGASATFNGIVRFVTGLTLAENATARFSDLLFASGSASLAEGSRLVVQQNGTATLALAASSTGTLEVESGATASLGNVTGTANYHFAGDGTVSLTSQTQNGVWYRMDSTGSTFSGTLDITLSGHFQLGADTAAPGADVFAPTARPGFVLSGNSGLILTAAYTGVENALKAGSLASSTDTPEIRGDVGANGYRYIALYQDGDTTFGGKFIECTKERSVGLIMNGHGTLTLTAENKSPVALTINTGTIALAGDNGHWHGDVVVNGGGQLYLQRDGALNSGKALTIVGNGVAEFTDASGTFHEARPGALKLANGINLSHSVTVLTPGASVMTEAGATATISGEIKGYGNLTKIGGGTLKISGTHTGTGHLDVEQGTLTLVSGSTWAGDIIVENGATLNTDGTGTFTVQGDIIRNYVSGTHADGIAALARATNSTVTLGGTTLNLTGGDFSGVNTVVGGMKLPGVSDVNSFKAVSIVGTTTVNVDGADLSLADIYGGSYLTGDKCNGISTGKIEMNLHSGTVGTVYGGHWMDGSGKGAVWGVSAGDIHVLLDGATVSGNIYGGSRVVRNSGDSTVTQGAVTVDLKSGHLAGNVYAGGKQEGSSNLQTASTEVKISNAVVFNGSDQIISGGYDTAKDNSTITGSRTLTLSSEGDYTNLGNLVFKEFDVINSSATSAVIGNFTNTGSLTKKGAGVVTLSQAQELTATTVEAGTLAFSGGATFTGDVTVADGAFLSLGGTVSLASTIQSAGTVDFSGATFALTEAAFTDGRYDIVTGTGSTTGTLTFSGLNGNVRVLGMGGGNVYLVLGEARPLVWNGTATEGGDTWSGANWLTGGTQTTFSAGDNVTFSSTAANKEVLVTATGEEVESITISGAGYTFTQGSLTASGGITVEDNASAVFQNRLTVGGATVIKNGGVLELQHDTDLSLAADNTNTGTLKVTNGATVDLGDVKGTAKYHLDGDGTVQMNTSDGHYYLVSAGNTFSGTLEIGLTGNKHFLIGSTDGSETNFAEGANPNLVLTGGSAVSTLIINSNYHGEGHVLNIGSLESHSAGVILSGKNGGNAANDNFRYIAVHQDTTTTFAGTFENTGSRDNNAPGLRAIGLIMNGTGTLILTADNPSTARLIVNSGTVALAESGNWAGNVTVEDGGQLYLQRSNALAAGKSLTISGSGTATRAGALKLDSVTLAHAVSIADGGASIHTDNYIEGTISGAISGGALTKTGAGTLILSGDVATSGISVEAGTLSLRSTVALPSAIENRGTVDFTGASLTITGVEGVNRYDIVTGTGTTTGSLTTGDITFSGVTPTGTLRLFGMGGGHVFVHAGAGELVWNGTDTPGGDTWAGDNWILEDVSTSLDSGDTARFTASAAIKNVVVADGGATAAAIEISATGYTFTGGAITTGAVTLAESTTTTFNNGLNATGLAVQGEGAALSIASGKTVAVNGAVTGGTLTVGGSGSLAVNGSGQLQTDVSVGGSAHLDLGSADPLASTATITLAGTLGLGDGATLNGKLNLTNGNVWVNGDASATINGAITGALAKTGPGTLTVSGTQTGITAIAVNSGTLAMDTDATLAVSTFGNGATLKIGTGHTLELTDVTIHNLASIIDHTTADADNKGKATISLSKVDNRKMQGTHNVTANFEFTATSGFEFNNWNGNAAYDSIINVVEGGSLKVDTDKLYITSYMQMNISGGSVTAPDVVVGADSGTNNCAHLTLESGNLNTHSITLNCRSNNAANHVTKFVMTGGTLDLTGGTGDVFSISSTNSGTRELSLTGGQIKVDAARTIGVDLTLGGVTITSTGTGSGLTFAAGKTVTWDSLITNNGGNLTFNGTVALAAGALDGVTHTYFDPLDTAGGNGFKIGKLLVQNTNGGTVTLGDAASLTVGGTASTEKLVALSSGLYTGEGTVYYVNTGVVEYGAATNSAASGTVSAFALTGGTLKAIQSGDISLLTGDAYTGTLEVAKGAVINLGNTSGDALYHLAGEGTVKIYASGGDYKLESTGNTFSGTLEIHLNGSQFFFGIGGHGTGVNFAESANPNLVLVDEAGRNRTVYINNNYYGEESVLNVGSIASTEVNIGISAKNDANPTGQDYRYIAVHQDTDTTFASTFIDSGTEGAQRSVGLMMNGAGATGGGTLTLTANNASVATLIINSGTIQLGEVGGTTGKWAGDVTVKNGGQLSIQRTGDGALASGKALSIAGTGVVAFTDAVGTKHEARKGALVLGNGVTVSNAITVDAAGASVMVGGNDAASINSSLSGGTLTKVGTGTLSVSNAVSGNFIVEEGTLNFSSYLYQNVTGIDLRADAKLILQQNWTSLDKAAGATALPRIDMAGGAVIELHNGDTNTRVNADIVVNATDKAAVIRGIDQGSNNMELKGTVSGAGTLQLRSLADGGVRNTNIWKVNSAISDGAKAALGLEIKDVTLTIGGTNASTFSGGTTISNSSVTVNKASAFGSGKLELTNSTVTLGTDLEVGAISGASGLVTGSHDISLTGAKGTATYSGAISGISLAKSGVGVQEFTNVGSLAGVSVTGGGLGLTGSAMELQNVSVGGSGTLTLGGNVSLDSAISSSGTVDFDSASFTLAASDFTDKRYDIVTGSGTTSGTIDLTVTGSATPARVVGLGSGNVYAYLGNGELTWDGTTATGGDAWGESNWLLDGSEASFRTGDTVHFTTAAENKAVTVASGGVTVGTMDITGTGYTFSGGAISATSLTLGEGVTATFQTGLTVAGDITLNGGTLKFETDGAYNVGMNMTGTGDVEISGSGTKTIGGKLTDVTLTMDGTGTLGFSQKLAMEGGKLVINSGTVTLNNHEGKISQLQNAEVEVYGGGKLTIQHDSLGWKDNVSDTTSLRSILLQGESETKRAVLSNDDSTGNNTFSAALNLAGHAVVESTNAQKTIKAWTGMSVTALDTDNEISAGLTIESDLTVTVGDATHTSSELEISGSLTGGHALGKEGSGKLTLSGNNTSFTGNIKTVAGTLDITGNTNASMLRLEAGTTNISSTVTAAKLQMVDQKTGNSAVNIKNGGSVTLSSDADDALVIAGWSDSSCYEGTLTVEKGGSLSAENATMQVSYWDNTTGHVHVNGGSVEVKGISFHHQIEADTSHQNGNVRGSLTLSNGGSLTVGSEGIKGVEKEGDTAKVSVTLGDGTIHSSADWTMGRFTDGATLVDVTLNGTETAATHFDTNGDKSGSGHTVTIDNNLIGTGALVKEGAGTLKLNGANTYTGSTTVEEGKLALGGSGSLDNGHMTLSAAHSDADATIQAAKIDGTTISGLEGTQGQVANLKVLYADTRVTFENMVISADSRIGKEPVQQNRAMLVEARGDENTPTEAAMSGSKLVLETGAGKNATLNTAVTLAADVTIDASNVIAAGSTISLITCSTFNVDVLSGSLTLDLTSLWEDISAARNRYVAVEFSNVSDGFAEDTVIKACIGNATPVEAVAYGSSGGAIAYFEVSQIPEPATGTLSVLALAALVSRRRRRQ